MSLLFYNEKSSCIWSSNGAIFPLIIQTISSSPVDHQIIKNPERTCVLTPAPVSGCDVHV